MLVLIEHDEIVWKTVVISKTPTSYNALVGSFFSFVYFIQSILNKIQTPRTHFPNLTSLKGNSFNVAEVVSNAVRWVLLSLLTNTTQAVNPGILKMAAHPTDWFKCWCKLVSFWAQFNKRDWYHCIISALISNFIQNWPQLTELLTF